MSKEYDVVVAGGGHYGLTAAGYLAKAGLNVCVVERREYVGGGTVTREVTLPGFKQDIASTLHTLIQANPLIKNDELKLVSKYGLKYITSLPDDNVMLNVFGDGREMSTYFKNIEKTCTSIEKFSKKDAESYFKFYQYASGVSEMMLGTMFSPPPSFGTLLSTLEQMGDEGRELLRLLLISAMDLADEWFESDEMKISIARMANELCNSPHEKGSAVIAFLDIPLMQSYGWALPQGGSGVLAEKLEQCVKGLGGTIRTSSTVKSIKIQDGKAKGVILGTGEEIIAKKAVVSSLSVKQLYLQMVDEKWLPKDFRHKVRRLKQSPWVGFLSVYALNNAPHWKFDEGNRSFMLFVNPTNSLREYLKIEEDFKAGITRTDVPVVVCQTRVDPTRAPQGKHTLYVYHLEPYHLQGGATRWDEIKEEVADGLLQTVRNLTTNMGDENILGRFVESPLDFERHNPAWEKGDFYGLGGYLEQSFSLRPLPGWNYKTPVERLYMCGPCTPPGGAVSGGSGRAVAQVIMEDLGIDFDKVASR